MRVFMVTGDDLAHFRGGTIHLMEQAQGLMAMGHQVAVFAQGLGAFPEPTPVPIRYLPALGRGLLRRLSYDLCLLAALLWHGLRGRPHVIHSRQMGYSATPLLAARLLRLPHVLEVNGVLRDELAGQRPSRVRLALIDFFARRNLRGSCAFTTTTAEYLQRLRQLYGADPSRHAQMPCGVNTDRFRPGAGGGSRGQARQRLGLDPEAFALVHVGSLYDWRGLDVLIEGLARLGGRVPRWQCWLVGDGVERSRLEALCRQRGVSEGVRFAGQVPYRQVPEWLVAADLGVVFYKPTRPVPGDPMKIYEYMACGLPVLAGDHPHYGGMVRAAQAGLVVDDTDPGAVADAVAALWADEEGRRRYGANGARVAAAEHSWARRARQLADLLEAAAGGRLPPQAAVR